MSKFLPWYLVLLKVPAVEVGGCVNFPFSLTAHLFFSLFLLLCFGFSLRSKCKSVAMIVYLFCWLSVCFEFIFWLFKILKVEVEQV